MNIEIKKGVTPKVITLGVAVCLIVLALSSATYALFYNETISSNTDSYSTGLLSITASSKSDIISLDNVLPMSDSDGSNTTPYTFTIKNVGNLNYKFNVKLLSTGSSDMTIDSQYIKLKIDDGDVTTLSALTGSVIKSAVTLAAGESIDISIRAWLSSDTPNSQIGKSFNSKIITDGQAVYTSTNNTVYGNYTGGAKLVADLFSSNKTTVNNNISYRYDTVHNLMIDPGNNIRYYGSSPNNYVYFNCGTYPSTDCEIWRIVGVFDGMIKIVRDTPIGTYLWDSTGSGGVNNWSISDLMRLLNPDSYYSFNDDTISRGLYWNSSSGNCYNESDKVSGTCSFSSTGIKNDTTRNIIEDVNWYLKGASGYSLYANQLFDKERTTGSVYGDNPTSWNGKVGLLYASDYGYAVDFNSCVNIKLNSYSSCASYNWLKSSLTNGGSNSWLLTPSVVESSVVYFVLANGSLLSGTADYTFNVNPTVYLKSYVTFDTSSGDGSSSNPYRINVS